MPAKASWLLLKVGPGLLVVTTGITKLNIAKAASTARAVLLPSIRKVNSLWRRPPIKIHKPITPLITIMITANTASRAINSEPSEPESIIDTISATSIMVTQSAKISVPKGSPTL